MKEQTISKATIDRLPLYYRTLRLAQDDGMDIISSDELGRGISDKLTNNAKSFSRVCLNINSRIGFNASVIATSCVMVLAIYGCSA